MGRQAVQMDPAVAAILSSSSGTGRRRVDRRERVRMTLELDPRIREVIREVAEAEGVSPAGVVNLFVADALGRYRSGELVFGEHTRPARNTRYEWVVELEDGFDGGGDDREIIG